MVIQHLLLWCVSLRGGQIVVGLDECERRYYRRGDASL